MEPGDLIADRYRVEYKIGEGGLGVVWRAIQVDVERPVAIKLLKSVKPAGRRRFQVEARALAKLQHPGCVTLHEVGELDDTSPFIVTEFLAGEALDARRGEQLPIDEVLRISKAIAEALEYAHSLGVVHRDLKPSNVFLTPNGWVKVLDFGLAKLLGDGGPALTATGEFMGTPHYVSPEQIRNPKNAGPPSDQYSLGALMFEMVEGHPPFRGESSFEVCGAHLNAPVPPIERPDCPPRLAAIVERLLQKSPAARFPDCTVLRRELDAIRAPRAPSAEPSRQRKRARRYPTSVIVGALAALIVVGTLGALMVQSAEESPPPEMPATPHIPTSLIRSAENPTSDTLDAGALPGFDVGTRADGRSDTAADGTQSPTTLPALSPPTVLASGGCGEIPRLTDGKLQFEVEVDGLARKVSVQFPADFDPDAASPAIFAFTYRRRWGWDYLERGGILAAKAAGFLVVALEPEEPDFKPTQSAYEQLEALNHRAPPHQHPWREPSDETFVLEAVAEAGRRTCIDKHRTFAIGHAEGAGMIHRLRCGEHFPFAAIALTGWAANADERCEPRHPVPTIRISGRGDTFVPYDGGAGCAGDRYRSAEATDELWSRANGCEDSVAHPWAVDERCELRQCTHAPWVGCAVGGGHYLEESFFNKPEAAGITRMITEGLGDRKATWFDPPSCAGSTPLELEFAHTVLPFFLHYAALPAQ